MREHHPDMLRHRMYMLQIYLIQIFLKVSCHYSDFVRFQLYKNYELFRNTMWLSTMCSASFVFSLLCPFHTGLGLPEDLRSFVIIPEHVILIQHKCVMSVICEVKLPAQITYFTYLPNLTSANRSWDQFTSLLFFFHAIAKARFRQPIWSLMFVNYSNTGHAQQVISVWVCCAKVVATHLYPTCCTSCHLWVSCLCK